MKETEGWMDRCVCVCTCDVLGQDISKVGAEASPQQHITSLGCHATSHYWGISTY